MTNTQKHNIIVAPAIILFRMPVLAMLLSLSSIGNKADKLAAYIQNRHQNSKPKQILLKTISQLLPHLHQKNEARKLAALHSLAEEAQAEAEELRDEEQDYYDNMPESLQGGEKGQLPCL